MEMINTLETLRNVFFDTETTGWTPGQIAQLSVIVENQGKIELAKNYFFTVDEMSSGAEQAHHLSIDTLKQLSSRL